MDNAEWENSVRKKIKYMVNQIWDGITTTDIERFLSNFGDNEKTVGLVLLDMLIYYSNEQEQAIVDNLIRLMERDIWIKADLPKARTTSDKINEYLQNLYRKKMCFVPVNDCDPSDSAFSLTALFKKSRYLPSFVEYASIDELPLVMSLGYKYIVFYDDLIGTGSQFETFWNWGRYKRGDKMVCISELAKRNSDIIWYYLALGGCDSGISKLKNDLPQVNVIVSEYFSENVDIFKDENEYWELNPDKKNLVIDFVRKKEKELNSRSKFGMNLPVLFQHGRASNSALSLYWYNNVSKWKALYKR